MRAVRHVVDVYRTRISIGWIFGFTAALTVTKWTHPGWWGLLIACGFAIVAGLVSSFWGRP